jgi:PhnB protein
MHTITPHMVVRDAAAAADWYKQALGADERGRIEVPGESSCRSSCGSGTPRRCWRTMSPSLGVLSPLSIGGSATVLHLYANDVDALWKCAVAAGAEVRQPLQDVFWGERYGQITDPFGHRWGLAQHLCDVPRHEIAEAAAAMFA